MSLLILLAQAAGAAAPEAAATQGVISYPPAFFADSQPTNALDMLYRVPGFALDVGATVRGYEGAAGNVLIDGKRPASKTDDLSEILRRIQAGQVERIELIRGGAPGIDMQGKSVLANVVRKQGGGFRAVFAVANNHIYDGRNTWGIRSEFSGSRGTREWDASARYGLGADDGAGEGPRLVINPSGAVTERSDVDQEGDGDQYVATGAYSLPSLGGRLKVNGRLFRDKFKWEEDNRVTFPAARLEETDDLYLRHDTEVGANFSRAFGPRTDLELVGLRQTRDQDITSRFRAPGDAGDFFLNRVSSETIGRAVLKYRWNDELSFEAGGEGAYNVLESTTRLTSGGAAVALPAANVEVSERRGEAFLKGVWKPSDKWTFETRLRYEGSAIASEGDVVLEKTLYYLKPRLAGAWSPNPNTQIRASFERVVGQLNFDSFVASSNLQLGTVTVGNPDLIPDQSWVAEAAIEQRFWEKGAVILTVRHAAITDVIDRAPIFVPGSVFDAPANIGDGTRDQLILNLTLPLDRLFVPGGQIRGVATWTRTEVPDPTTGEMREISGQRPLAWEVFFTQDLPRWKMSWGVDVYGAWRESYYRFNEIETRKLKTYVKPFAEWKPRPDLSVRVELPNITERGFRQIRQVYNGPRSPATFAYTEDRDIQFGRMFYVRVRKTWG